jgi:type IV secretion system protein VirB9
MRRPHIAIVAAAAAWAAGAGAQGDDRIRYVDYDPDEVVTIEAAVGIVVHVVLEPGETYVAHAFGDGKAWDFAYRQNHLFLKAVATEADSNLTVVTDKRSYHFAVKLLHEGRPTYELAFRYRESRARRRVLARDQGLDEAFERAPRKANLSYTMSGDLDIAPLNCWDDGEFTSFRFGPNADLPAIYMVDADGTESVVNQHTAGASNEIVVLHKVASRWVLRLGNRALAIWNDGFGADGRRNESRTSVDDVRRVLWR